ncbi:MAG TPA: phosphoribosyltransferase family protein [Patescibacteria group bacterium]
MFENRDKAGVLLGEYLMGKETQNTIVVGIPRGGITVGLRIARMLNVPFDMVFVKKIVSSLNPEFALGAAGEGGEVYWDEESVKDMSDWDKKEALKESLLLLHKRKKLIRSIYPEVKIEGKDVILVDDGIATGATVLCALLVMQGKGAKSVSLASPVIANDTYKSLRKDFDSIYALSIPTFFNSVGQVYKNFSQIEDEEIIKLLKNN